MVILKRLVILWVGYKTENLFKYTGYTFLPNTFLQEDISLSNAMSLRPFLHKAHGTLPSAERIVNGITPAVKCERRRIVKNMV